MKAISLQAAGALLLMMTTECAYTAEHDRDAHTLIPQLFEAAARDLAARRAAPPEDKSEWPRFQRDLIARHARAIGVSPTHSPEPTEFEVLETLNRNGYTLKKILFESRPGAPIPAHLYIPENSEAPAPAVLCVHGHWDQAKNAPEVHARCVFLASHGFVVLALDAIGSGERAYRGITYHGRQLGYQVLPTGITLAGLQVEDNRRAIDLLSTLPEVDAGAIGVTGASGGGNQTFHITILDSRVKAAVAVCFYGSYEGYLRGAHCACELVPGVLTYADEGLAAGLIASRPLTIVAAIEDHGAAFRIEDARRNAKVAARLYAAAGAGESFRLAEFDGGHDYSRPMRETMVAFFERHLMGKDSGERVTEPPLDLLAPDDLTVLPGNTLPENSLFVPQIAAQRAQELISDYEDAGTYWNDEESRIRLREGLIDNIFGGFPEGFEPARTGPVSQSEHTLGVESRVFVETEPGVEVELHVVQGEPGNKANENTILVIGSVPEAFTGPLREGWSICAFDPRGTGSSQWPQANAVDCEDYLLAQGSNTLGRPMLGQWVWDTVQVRKFLSKQNPERRIALFGEGVMGLTAILAGAVDEESVAVCAMDFLASYHWPDRFADCWGLVHFVPGILRYGDIGHIAAGIGPRPFLAVAPQDGGGSALDRAGLETFRRRLMSGNPSSQWPDLRLQGEMSAGEALQFYVNAFRNGPGR